MKTKKQRHGISLIVLVITIIVMIILATAIIISLSNNGIIDSAKNAVDKTNESEIQELASLAWADAYAENVGKSEEELLPILKASVEKALEDNDLDKENYGIEVTTTGVTIVKGWLQTKDRTVIKGDTVLNIGADISYDETNGGTVTVEKNVDWKVLGAENGELLIMSTTDIASKTFNSEKTLEGGKKAYENGISELNDLCKPYGNGEYATGARSITVEDVDRVTGYDKTTYGKETIYEYGNVVTYSYNGTNNPAYSGTNGVNGTLTGTHGSGFYWYDLNNVYHNVIASNLTSNISGVITADNVETKVKSTYYTYDVDLKTAVPDAYNMLFGLGTTKTYWLASTFVIAHVDYILFGFRAVNGSRVSMGSYFVGSYGGGTGASYGVRAVVQLSHEYNP